MLWDKCGKTSNGRHIRSLLLCITGEAMDNLHLEAGDDAGKVKWVDISEKLQLYASHADFICRVAGKRGAHWHEDADGSCCGGTETKA